MRNTTSTILLLTLLAVHAVHLPGQAAKAAIGSGHQIINIDFPGATYTAATAINDAGVITGTYLDTSNVFHGFLRKADGTMISFDPPSSNQTQGLAINSIGQIAGYYGNAAGKVYGFIREVGGTFITIDPSGDGRATFPAWIDDSGNVSGEGSDSRGYYHAFTDIDNVITLFDPPSSIIYLDDAYYLKNGEVVGTYQGEEGVLYGYIRDVLGNYTIITAPGASTNRAGEGTWAFKMNTSGTIVGFYTDERLASRGYLRNQDGSFKKIEAPGSGTGLFQGTYAEDINDAGQVVGARVGTNTVAFLRSPSGKITEFNAPGAGNGKGQGTDALRINSGGIIIGQYTDANNVSHAFLMY
jgi:hypothetical protein